ncbi:TPA: acylneuraminate cytidylyltransferase family protein [Clostridium botulinum]|uniref:acylneuraminate cytidylyltransferase family protein n=1 Tax=Clostridium botulinum TaxID=1491 RepID=UPI0033090743|nr:acylneuraminate cytidylyltransferase family protein [Clostridium botulinum]
MNILGLIPARGGSKGLPGKNIRNLNGKPLIEYAINEAKKSKYMDRLIVSTNDYGIAKICEELGAEIPFMRPNKLAQDNSKVIDTYIYTLNKLKEEFNYIVDILVIIQPTSPLRTVHHIDSCIELFFNKNADSVVTVCEVEHSPYWYKVLNKENKIESFIEYENSNDNRQQLPKVYRPNGAVYVFKKDLIINKKSYYTDKSYGYIMKNEDSIDIDSIIDFKFAEFLIKEKSEKHF